MQYSIYRISLDLQDSANHKQVNVKKGDTARQIMITLMDNSMPYVMEDDCTAALHFKRSDGSAFYDGCRIREDGVIIYTFTSNLSAITGVTECEIRIFGSDNRMITSAKFTLIINDVINAENEDDGIIEGETILEPLIRAVNNLDVDANRDDDGVVTITVTKKDGSTKTVQVITPEQVEGITEAVVNNSEEAVNNYVGRYIDSIKGDIAITITAESKKDLDDYVSLKEAEFNTSAETKTQVEFGKLETYTEEKKQEIKDYADNLDKPAFVYGDVEYNTSNIQVGTGYLNKSGGVYASTSRKVTDYIKVVSGSNLEYKAADYFAFGYPVIACYDADKNYINDKSLIAAEGVSGVGEFTIPGGVEYIRCGVLNDNFKLITIGKVPISEYVEEQLKHTVKSVNEKTPDENGDVNIDDIVTDVIDFEPGEDEEVIFLEDSDLDELKGMLYEERVTEYTKDNIKPEIGYIGSDGIPNSLVSYRHSYFLKTHEGHVISYEKIYTNSSSVPLIACYDENKNYLMNKSIIKSTYGEYSGECEIPDGVSYFRFSYKETSEPKVTITEIVESIPELKKDLEGYVKKIQDWTLLKCDENSVNHSQGWIKGDGAVAAGYAGYRTTYFIPVSHGQLVTYTNLHSYGSYYPIIGCYDGEKIYKSMKSLKPSKTGYHDGAFTIPEEISYIRFAFRNNDDHPFSAEITEEVEFIDQIKKDYNELLESSNQLKSGKLDKPSDPPIVGKVLKVKSVNEDGSFVCEWAESTGNVSDVAVNGESIVVNGVASIPVGSAVKAGVHKVNDYYGTRILNNDGLLATSLATEADILARTNGYKPIVPSNLEKAVTSVGDSLYEPKKGEWTLKGTLTTENKDTGVNVDLSGCSEIWLRGVVEATSSTNIRIGAMKVVGGLITGKRRCIVAHIVNSPYGLYPDEMFYSDGEINSNPSLQRIAGGYLYGFRSTFYYVSDANSISFSNASLVTDCNIEIYAR